LRTLLVTMLVVAAFFGGIATERRWAVRRQRSTQLALTTQPLQVRLPTALKTGQVLSIQSLKEQERALKAKSLMRTSQ
jgi:hypothetical protein